MKGKTALVIAHRLSTIRQANCIYVLKDGEIVESGSHDDLMARDHGVYRHLHEVQFNTEEAEAAVMP